MSLNNHEIQSIELKMIEQIDSIARENKLHYSLGYGTVLGAVRHRGFIPWDTDIDILVSYKDYDKFCNMLKYNLSEEFYVEYIKFDNKYSSLKARVVKKDEDSDIVHVDIFPINYAPRTYIGKFIISKLLYINYRAYFVKTSNKKVAKSYPNFKKTIFYILKSLLFILPKKVFILIHNIIGKLLIRCETDIVFNMCGSYGRKEFIKEKWFRETIMGDFENLRLPIPKEFRDYLTHLYGDYNTPKKNNYV